MKKTIILSLMGICILNAQLDQLNITAPFFFYFSTSARVFNTNLWINIDAIPDTVKDSLGNPIDIDTIKSIVTFYSSDQSTWDSVILIPKNEKFYEYTWEGSGSVGNQTSYVFFIRGKDLYGPNFTLLGTTYNSNDVFPLPLNLATKSCIESAGDADPTYGFTWLDLTNFYISQSDGYFYAKLENNGGGWPLDEGGWFPMEFYGYAVAVINPIQFVQDTDWVYAALVADVWLIGLSPGLYRIPVDSADKMVQIGNIEYIDNGAYLEIRFDPTPIINDPYFGPYDTVLAVAATTLYMDTDTTLFTDFTQPCRLYHKILSIGFGTNITPFLTSSSVVPDSGDTTTLFSFFIKYYDQDNNLPVIRNLIVQNKVDQSASDTFVVGTPDHYYADTSLFVVDSMGPFLPGWNYYWFYFNDGDTGVVSLKDSFYVQGVDVKEIVHRNNNRIRMIVINRNIKVYGVRNFKLDIFSISGRKIYSFKQNSSDLSIPSSIRKGIYFLSLKTSRENIKRKVVVFK